MKPSARRGPHVVLVGDIGGVNTRLLLFQLTARELRSRKAFRRGRRAPGTLVRKRTFRNDNPEYRSFDDILGKFLPANEARPTVACFAVAGPVRGNRCALADRGWALDGLDLALRHGIAKVHLINAFEASGYGALCLEDSQDCVTLQEGQSAQPNGVVACIGAGAGLGECFVVPNGAGTTRRAQAFPSEGGHCEYAPRSGVEAELVEFLKRRFGSKARVSVERVASGVGVVNIYDFLAEKYPDQVDARLHKRVLAAGEAAGPIIARGADAPDGLCERAMRIFASSYGAEAGNVALKWLPRGGIYVTGGLTPKNLRFIRGYNSPFMQAFRDKGRLSDTVRSFPVRAVMVDDLGERGAHLLACRMLAQLLDQERAGAALDLAHISDVPLGSLTAAAALAAFAVGFATARRLL